MTERNYEALRKNAENLLLDTENALNAVKTNSYTPPAQDSASPSSGLEGICEKLNVADKLV